MQKVGILRSSPSGAREGEKKDRTVFRGGVGGALGMEKRQLNIKQDSNHATNFEPCGSRFVHAFGAQGGVFGSGRGEENKKRDHLW